MHPAFFSPSSGCPQQRVGDRQVFWLPDLPNLPSLPTSMCEAVAIFGISSPVTAAGPRRIPTGFPIKLEKHLSVPD
jgi:hypothetical protein